MEQDGRYGEGGTHMLATFIQQVINGLMLGGSYALVAIGYTLISRFASSISHFLNFKLPVECSTQPQPLQDILL
jgi:hypothetical protein